MDRRYSLPPHIRAVISDDGGVLLDLKRGRCLSLNPVGGQVWKALEQHSEGLTVDGLVDELLPVFVGVERDILLRDMSKFLPELESKGVISNGNGTHSLSSSSKITLPRIEQVMSAPASASIGSNESNVAAQPQDEPYVSGEKSAFLYSALAMVGLVCVDLTLKVAGFSLLYRIVNNPRRKRRGISRGFTRTS